jgi:hypothetical protein
VFHPSSSSKTELHHYVQHWLQEKNEQEQTVNITPRPFVTLLMYSNETVFLALAFPSLSSAMGASKIRLKYLLFNFIMLIPNIRT